MKEAGTDGEQTTEGNGGRSTRGPTATTTLNTTAHHPFWDATAQAWTNAADLTPGESTLIGPDGSTLQVVEVRNHTGDEYMHDLTVATIHTYYVVAGDTPVLVHNCGSASNEIGRAGEDALGIGPGAKSSIPSITGGPGRSRVPDRIGTYATVEVKNVSKLKLTNQILDMVDDAAANNRTLVIIARQDTRLTRPMRQMQEMGFLRVFKWLPPLDV